MSDFKNTFRRLEKIRATFEQLREENQSLRARLKKRDDPLFAKMERLKVETRRIKRDIEGMLSSPRVRAAMAEEDKEQSSFIADIMKYYEKPIRRETIPPAEEGEGIVQV